MNNKLFALALIMVISGCTSLNELDEVNPLTQVVKGDYVKIVTFSGESYQFVVREVTDIALFPEDGYEIDSLQQSTIKSISVKEFSVLNTASLMVGSLVAFAFISGSIWLLGMI